VPVKNSSPNRGKSAMPRWSGRRVRTPLAATPPAPAVGRHFLLDFAAKGIRAPRCELRSGPQAQGRALLFGKPAIRARCGRPPFGAKSRRRHPPQADAGGVAPKARRSHRGPSGRGESIRPDEIPHPIRVRTQKSPKKRTLAQPPSETDLQQRQMPAVAIPPPRRPNRCARRRSLWHAASRPGHHCPEDAARRPRPGCRPPLAPAAAARSAAARRRCARR